MQCRVLAAASAVMVLFSVLAVVVLVNVFSYTLESGVKSRLEASLYGVMGVAEVLEDRLWLPSALPEASFNQLTSGLYAWVQAAQGFANLVPEPGVTPTTVIWQSESSLGKVLPDVAYVASGDFNWQNSELGGQPVWVLSFSSTWSLGPTHTGYYQFSLAQAKAPFLNQVAIFKRQLIVSFGALAVLLSCIQWFLLRRGLRPLARLTGQLSEIEAGSRDAVAGYFPMELKPMVANLNTTLQSERQQRERYRNTLADLAHSLKTPLTIIKNTLKSELPQDYATSAILEQVQRMDSIVQYQLKRSVVQSSSAPAQRTGLVPVLEKILGAMEKVHRDRNIILSIEGRDSVAGIQVLMEETDLFEVLGNVVDNAYKYCDHQVRIVMRLAKASVRFSIEDDGPGIPMPERAAVLARGKRLDQQGVSGQGIGMAVVADICRVYHMPLEVSQSDDLAGAQISMDFSYFEKTNSPKVVKDAEHAWKSARD
jgi:two-component system sensor histidine kinase PhoQ